LKIGVDGHNLKAGRVEVITDGIVEKVGHIVGVPPFQTNDQPFDV